MINAALAIGLIDLTSLNDNDTAEKIAALCTKARTHKVAAVCVYPAFVKQAKLALAGSAVKIATVVNFPHGTDNIDSICSLARSAIIDGADEIDVVIDWQAAKDGNTKRNTDILRQLRYAAPAPIKIKAILETGMLQDSALITAMAELAIKEGVDFLKTSTGKVPVNATLESVRLLLEAIKASGNGKIGCKASGGIRTTAEALTYLEITKTIMGEGFLTPATFRFGASALLDDLLGASPAAVGY